MSEPPTENPTPQVAGPSSEVLPPVGVPPNEQPAQAQVTPVQAPAAPNPRPPPPAGSESRPFKFNPNVFYDFENNLSLMVEKPEVDALRRNIRWKTSKGFVSIKFTDIGLPSAPTGDAYTHNNIMGAVLRRLMQLGHMPNCPGDEPIKGVVPTWEYYFSTVRMPKYPPVEGITPKAVIETAIKFKDAIRMNKKKYLGNAEFIMAVLSAIEIVGPDLTPAGAKVCQKLIHEVSVAIRHGMEYTLRRTLATYVPRSATDVSTESLVGFMNSIKAWRKCVKSHSHAPAREAPSEFNDSERSDDFDMENWIKEKSIALQLAYPEAPSIDVGGVAVGMAYTYANHEGGLTQDEIFSKMQTGVATYVNGAVVFPERIRTLTQTVTNQEANLARARNEITALESQVTTLRENNRILAAEIEVLESQGTISLWTHIKVSFSSRVSRLKGFLLSLF